MAPVNPFNERYYTHKQNFPVVIILFSFLRGGSLQEVIPSSMKIPLLGIHRQENFDQLAKDKQVENPLKLGGVLNNL